MKETKMWEIYERLHEIVCVVDVENHELIYVNQRACELYDIEDREQIKGKKCYEVLMRSLAPCAICNNNKLCTGAFLEEVRYNPVVKKKLAIKDTIVEEDGKKYRFELAVDLSAYELDGAGNEDKEAMVNEGLRISLAATTPEESILALLEYLGLSLHSGRAYIFEETRKGMLDNTYEWCANSMATHKENLQGIPREVVASWYQKFLKGENIVIKDIESVRESEPMIYEYLAPQSIRSLVVSPLMNEGRVIGFYGVDNPPEKSLQHIMTLLQILGHFIVSLLHRRNHVRRLEELCFQDRLTGIGNRHAMNEYLDKMKSRKSVGVLYCDVMGLKQMNDTKGHREGDLLLVRASECLRKAFGEYPLFRIGGDEFLALCEGMTQEELMRSVNLLREEMREKDALMALGSAWHAAGIYDIEQLIRKADSRMYEDKRAWYENSRDRRRV
ncbi:MAG: diguanylate cyclase [Lachnospiraceae bacterium]|nr:diguanylate cyclase [Lachnospiraceae bacterium]